jgi:hypothetical protein
MTNFYPAQGGAWYDLMIHICAYYHFASYILRTVPRNARHINRGLRVEGLHVYTGIYRSPSIILERFFDLFRGREPREPGALAKDICPLEWFTLRFKRFKRSNAVLIVRRQRGGK